LLVGSNNQDAERSERRDLVHAVVDGPDGTHAVELPSVRADALRIKLAHRESFWCSRQAGGCGGGLVLAAGPVRVPYFRHRSGADCALAKDGARAARSYEHLHFQRALLAWLEAQGLHATTEYYLGPDGRADLHVLVRSRRHTIEVQLSPLGINEWAARDARYRRQVDHVSWLYGPHADTLAASEQAHRGYALRIRRNFNADGPPTIEIGVATDLAESWSPLSECELRPEQFWTPHLDQALADLASAREDAAAEEARREALRELAAGRRPTDAQHARAKHGPPPTTRPTEGYGTLSWYEHIHPELRLWTPTRGWEWTAGLTDDAKAAARVICYLVSRLYASGPVSMLLLPDEGSGREVVEALERADFLRRYEHRGVDRWERLHG
jgi:hypothetical protein